MSWWIARPNSAEPGGDAVRRPALEDRAGVSGSGLGQLLGMSKSLATWAASPRSPFALILPVMNIIIGLPSPETTFRKTTGSMVMASLGSRTGWLVTVQAPFSITVSYVSVLPP